MDKNHGTGRIPLIGSVVFFAFLGTGCASTVLYSKPDAPWATIQKIAILPLTSPSENPVRRQLMSQLFAAELRQVGLEIVEVPLTDSVGKPQSIEDVAKAYQVDAVFSGAVDETQGTVVHVHLYDGATGEVLWSSTYLLGFSAEFLSFRTQQQQFQRAFRRIAREFSRHRVVPTSS